jgi:phosphatidylserine/phosphatidylglycerophosphate/cardiolipin synthase-like enzyme
VDDQSLTQLIQILKDIPDSYLDQFENLCEENQQYPLSQFLREIQKEFGSLPVGRTLNDWLGSNSVITPNEISLITKIIRLSKSEEETPGLQLVWSGPLPEGIPIRSTEQVIIELIENASESLFISSFAVYKAKNVLQKISDAIERGIKVSILLETPESSHYKIKVDPLKFLPKKIIENATILIWPFQKRIKNEKHDGGSLHAKFVIQDDSRLFISSANLTESAFERNIELGVLISDKKIIINLRRHLSDLIRESVLVNIT